MADYQAVPPGRENNISPQPKTFHAQLGKSNRSEDLLSLYSEYFLDRADSIIYAIVGGCFLLIAILALIYTFWAFGISIIELQKFPIDQRPAQGAQTIIELVSGLLLVLIIMEILGTVIHYLQVHTTSLRPFLFIGIVSATRSILSIGARLSVEGFNISPTDFTHAMIELGVSAAVILALGITLKLLGRLVEIDVSRE